MVARHCVLAGILDLLRSSVCLFSDIQGRRRLFKSGPVEEAIKCGRHERGRAREGQCPRMFGQSTFSTDPGWYFSKRYTLSLAHFQ